MRGVHLGFANIVDCRMVGLQAGVFNQARELDGVQIGLVNSSGGAVRGVQLGIVNDAWQLRGVQFGFINYSEFCPAAFSLDCSTLFRNNGLTKACRLAS